MKPWHILLLLATLSSTSASASASPSPSASPKPEAKPKGHILTSPRKTYYPPSAKVAFEQFQSFGGSFTSPSSDGGYPSHSSSGGYSAHSNNGGYSNGGYSHSSGSGGYSHGGYSHSNSGSYSNENNYSQTSNTFSHQNENFSKSSSNSFSSLSSQEPVPAVGENFLRISQTSKTSFSQSNQNSGNSESSPTVPATIPTVLPAVVSVAPVLPVVPLAPQQPAPVGSRQNGVSATAPVSFGTPNSNLEDILEQEWNAFKIAFNKTYATFEEERQRREIFIENRNKVARYNQEYGTGRHSFVQKLNQYADLLNHEFNSRVNGLNRTRNDGTPPPERKSSAFIPSANVNLPNYVDWREAGAVTPVKRQGTCGACYAFAAAGSLEGQNFRKTGRLVELSPQNLIDCTGTYSNSGCVGGLMEYAFEYVRDNRGIDTENAYPFEERDGQQCRYRSDGYGAHDTGYIVLDEGDEQALMMAIATIGPVAAGIDAHPDAFQFYSNGIYFEPACGSSSDNLNHAVLVIGYGTEPNGQSYWLIKNSYGPEWGIGGYMKLARNSNNHCGIASYAVYPLV